jgi:hypothetical protein
VPPCDQPAIRFAWPARRRAVVAKAAMPITMLRVIEGAPGGARSGDGGEGESGTDEDRGEDERTDERSDNAAGGLETDHDGHS